MQHKYDFATKEELDIIHNASMKALAEVGVIYESDAAIQVFTDHGFKTDGHKVFMTENDVWNALKTAPKQFNWHGRKGHVTIGGGKPVLAPTYGSVFVLEDGKYHNAEKRDFLNFVKMTATSPALDVSNPNIMDSSFMGEVNSNWAQATVLALDERPAIGMVDGTKNAQDSIAMTQEFLGIYDEPVVAGLINTASPCHVSAAMGEALIEYSKAHQIMFISSASMPGLTCPGSLGSLLMLNNAEVLSGVVLSQLVSPGAPVIYGIQSHGCDLRFMTPCVGSPEECLIWSATKSLGNYYGIPVRTGGSSGDSKQVDMQAGVESFSTMWFSLLSGADLIVHATGGMDQDCSVSYDKFIYDEEIILSCKHILRGIEISEESMLYDCLAYAGAGGGFMDLPEDLMDDSYEYYQDETLVLQCATHKAHAKWIDTGEEQVTERTKKIYEKRIAEFEMPELDKDHRDVLTKYIDADLLDF